MLIIVAFVMSSFLPIPVKAQEFVLPKIGVMVLRSSKFIPAHLVGMTIDPKNALKFDFIIHKGEAPLSAEQKQKEYKNLVKYFLAALAVPDGKQWVNLSPYEGNRMIEPSFGLTQMGRDLLAQDYTLKQFTSSMMHPDGDVGKKFWKNVYRRVFEMYGTTNIPVDTFNKVWIIPNKAVVYEKGQSALIVESHLKVMLEEDYVSLERHSGAVARYSKQSNTHALTSNIVRSIVLPAIEKEVNEGSNFANLRQIVSAMLLATWYKKSLKQSFLAKIYADKGKVKGVDQDPNNNTIIWEQYARAFKKGAFNLIRADYDQHSHQIVPRKYFSGGFDAATHAADHGL